MVLSNRSMVYDSLPRHRFVLPSFIFILLLKGLCGAQVGINMIAYLHCVYCKVKTRIHGKNVILLDQDVHVCGYMVDACTPLVDMISLF